MTSKTVSQWEQFESLVRPTTFRPISRWAKVLTYLIFKSLQGTRSLFLLTGPRKTPTGVGIRLRDGLRRD